MADKYHSDTQEKIETILYSPGLQDSQDLEPATKTITALAEATGLANADYSKVLTLPKPADTRLELLRIGSRLSVTIDSFDLATILYCRVYVDAQDSDHRLFDLSWTTTGNQLAGTSATSGTTLYPLLSDGQSHTFYFFFWVNQANNAVISLVQLWEACGRAGAAAIGDCLKLNHIGLVQMAFLMNVLGSAAAPFTVELSGSWDKNGIWRVSGSQVFSFQAPGLLVLCDNYLQFLVTPGNITDLPYVQSIRLVLRSEQ